MRLVLYPLSVRSFLRNFWRFKKLAKASHNDYKQRLFGVVCTTSIDSSQNAADFKFMYKKCMSKYNPSNAVKGN